MPKNKWNYEIGYCDITGFVQMFEPLLTEKFRKNWDWDFGDVLLWVIFMKSFNYNFQSKLNSNGNRWLSNIKDIKCHSTRVDGNEKSIWKRGNILF